MDGPFQGLLLGFAGGRPFLCCKSTGNGVRRMAATEHESERSGRSLLMRGLLLAARDEFKAWLELAEQGPDPAQLIAPLNALAAVAHTRGDLEEALACLLRALPLTDLPGVSGLSRLRVRLNLMTLYTDMARLEDALLVAEGLSDYLTGEGAPLARVYWLNMSMLYWRRQEWMPMRHASRKAYQLSQTARDLPAAARAMTNLGIAHLEMGAYRLAERDLTRALKIGEQLAPSEVAYAHAELGRLHSLRGEYQAALQAGRNALAALLTDVSGLDKEEVARVSRLFAVIFSTTGQRNLALKYLNRAAAYFSQLGLRAEWQRSTEMIGQLLAMDPRPGRSSLPGEVHRLDFLTMVLDLTDDLESVDPYLRGHSDRVASLAALLGEELGLSEEELTTLHFAARLHDVGMIAVDVELFQKAGPLTESEARRVALHTTIGEEMLRPHGLSRDGLRAVRHHHEHWDGSGGPDGLTGEDIPLLARMIALADVYDALTSDRVHRRAMSHVEATAVLRTMAGKELDPHLVERFLFLHEGCI